ncbi:MAG: prepilin-type N-terminal cleavage/methylation domain-containing protein [Candidatus Omnitrophica bacterium]|nr:prepilin-type N-terminal cleavage/methylation domain-containing protein [Candidatus Omnitrophota bacterium]
MIRNKFAFTMIELLLVMVILAVITALAIPNLRNTQSGVLLQRASEDLRQTMRYAQLTAIAKAEPIRLSFSKDLDTYQILEPAEETKTTKPEVQRQYFDENGKLVSEMAQNWNKDNEQIEYVPIKGRMGQLYHVQGGVKIVFDKEYVEFFPDGRADKINISVCQNSQCYELSTKKQRGLISLEKIGNNDEVKKN